MCISFCFLIFSHLLEPFAILTVALAEALKDVRHESQIALMFLFTLLFGLSGSFQLIYVYHDELVGLVVSDPLFGVSHDDVCKASVAKIVHRAVPTFVIDSVIHLLIARGTRRYELGSVWIVELV